MRTIASVGAWIFGSGTSSTRTSRLPCHATAIIEKHPSPCATHFGRSHTPDGANRSDVLDDASNPVLAVHEVEPVVDLVEPDPVRDEQVHVDIARQVAVD